MTKVTIGLKKQSESGAKQDQQPADIELTEEDLKQIAGGTTKAVQTRLPGVRITE
jgi:bacteriocin-like protein